MRGVEHHFGGFNQQQWLTMGCIMAKHNSNHRLGLNIRGRSEIFREYYGDIIAIITPTLLDIKRILLVFLGCLS